VNRRARRVARAYILILGVCALHAARAHAQAPALTPPELLQDAEAAYPQEARAERLEATVLLKLTIDTQGAVSDAEVLEPAGHGFDEAARQAALRFRFVPAKRDGVPIVATIRYPYRFEPPPLPTGSVAGHVPMVDAQGPVQAFVRGPDGGEHPAEVEPSGGFRVSELEPGAYAVRVTDGVRTATADVTVNAGAETEVTLAWPQPTAASAPPPPSAAAATPVEVHVQGERSAAERLQHSAEAVNVVELRRAHEQTADLGEVLARTQGVSVRREGGLGSNVRFSLNGLTDDQIRFFLDGVPLELAGFPFGVANVPVNLVDRVEVYRGVVPVRFGADALGGVVNLVTPDLKRSYFDASYQVGSFGTHRVALGGRYYDPDTGFVLSHTAYLDIAKNDYDVTVQVPTDDGSQVEARVPRFHDRYRAYGATLEGGVIDRPWAKRLLLMGYATSFDRQVQNNVIMTVPYGEVRDGETDYGATAKYDVELGKEVELNVIANYSHRAIRYVDDSTWVYDWYGRRIHERLTPGEVGEPPADQTTWQNAVFGRALATWRPAEDHTFRATATPTFTTRYGQNLLHDTATPDPQSPTRSLLTVVLGLEYQLDLWSDRFSNIAFFKDYIYHADGEYVPPAGGGLRDHIVDSHTQGAGDSLRFRFTPWLYAKASYEYATRLPRPDEAFGNGVLTRQNPTVRPEVSHNVNIGPRVELRDRRLGELTVDVNGFLRDSDRMIVLINGDKTSQFQNVLHARGLGLENALSWLSPRRWVGLDGTLTWQDLRNISRSGPFADVHGDRVPNRPYLFASWGGRLRFEDVTGQGDSIEPFYIGRYVHQFYRGWESLGINAPNWKQTVDAQVSHDVGVTWIGNFDFARTSVTLEVQNLTNAKLYDNFGVQRPGRAFYAKLAATLR
jgi:TonB family protein